MPKDDKLTIKKVEGMLEEIAHYSPVSKSVVQFVLFEFHKCNKLVDENIQRLAEISSCLKEARDNLFCYQLALRVLPEEYQSKVHDEFNRIKKPLERKD